MRKTKKTQIRLVAFGVAAMLLLSGCATGTLNTDGKDPAESAKVVNELIADSPRAAADLILPGSTMEKIKERGVLRIGGFLDTPRWSMQDPNDSTNIVGFDANIGKMLATYILGEPKYELINVTSETREAMLINETVDVVIGTYTITEERAAKIGYAGPYFMSGLGLLIRADDSSITKYQDLADKTVIFGRATPPERIIPQLLPTAKTLALASDPEGIDALIQKRGDAYVTDIATELGLAENNPAIKLVGEPFTEEPYGIGIRHGDEDFKAFINGWLEKIYEGGQWKQNWNLSFATLIEGDAPEPPSVGSVPGS